MFENKLLIYESREKRVLYNISRNNIIIFLHKFYFYLFRLPGLILRVLRIDEMRFGSAEEHQVIPFWTGSRSPEERFRLFLPPGSFLSGLI